MKTWQMYLRILKKLEIKLEMSIERHVEDNIDQSIRMFAEEKVVALHATASPKF